MNKFWLVIVSVDGKETYKLFGTRADLNKWLYILSSTTPAIIKTVRKVKLGDICK